MGEQHFNFLLLSTCRDMGVRQCEVASQIPGALIDRAHAFAGWRIRRAPLSKYATVAIALAGTVANEPVLIDLRAGHCRVAL